MRKSIATLKINTCKIIEINLTKLLQLHFTFAIVFQTRRISRFNQRIKNAISNKRAVTKIKS